MIIAEVLTKVVIKGLASDPDSCCKVRYRAFFFTLLDYDDRDMYQAFDQDTTVPNILSFQFC